MRKDQIYEKSTEKGLQIQSNKPIQDNSTEISLQNIVTKLKLRNCSQKWSKVTKSNADLFKCHLCHSGDLWMKFRNHRRVSNDRSGPDEGDHAEAIEVGPVPEALDHAKAGVLRRDLATWSDVVDSLSLFCTW